MSTGMRANATAPLPSRLRFGFVGATRDNARSEQAAAFQDACDQVHGQNGVKTRALGGLHFK